MTKPKIAVIGGGVAGLTTAWKLQHHADITLFEKNDYVGGHTRTLRVPDGVDAGTPIDTGFIVMNHRNYPHFTQLLSEWDVPLEDSEMSFSYHENNSGYAYAGTTFKGVFPSIQRLFDPRHWSLLKELRRFGKVGTHCLNSGEAASLSLGEFLKIHHFSPNFINRYLFAMGAAIWSSPPDQLADFPAEPYLHFFQNHGLLTLKNRPQWRVVSGGSNRYVQTALSKLNARVELGRSPEKIFRRSEGVTLHFSDGRKQDFDHVVIATHADQALGLLGDPDPQEQALLGSWTYQANEVVLHRWEGVMPHPQSCWAAWNFACEQGATSQDPVSVSYWMNRLQNLKTKHNYFVTLNRKGEIPKSEIINRTVLHHPQYDRKAIDTQKPLRERNGTRNTWLAGSYFGYGFHEDAVRSGVEASDQIISALP
ncbi:FAD-dependent oxidoreductase [Kiritimatiellota bacterium B12222]|nr:FAD-dependent oxidoreductase [Kiritimatiellota bacterium B12222]